MELNSRLFLVRLFLVRLLLLEYLAHLNRLRSGPTGWGRRLLASVVGLFVSTFSIKVARHGWRRRMTLLLLWGR